MRCPVDVDQMLSSAPVGVLQESQQKISKAIGELRGPTPATHDLTKHELRELAKKWSRSTKKGKQEMVVALRAVCDGEPFAEHGNHDNMLYRIAATVTETWPYASPESIASLLAPSLQVMSPGESLDWALEKLRRKKAEAREELEVNRSSRISEHFCGKRDTPYSEDEIQQFEAQIDASMKRRWVVQRGKNYFLFAGKPNGDGTCHEGNYDSRYTSDDVVNAARTILAPAASVGVTLDVITEKGVRAKTPQELVRDYGCVAKSMIADLTADFSYYDNDTGVFVEAPCPMRDITPREHPDIDRWITFLAGPERAQALREWIAWVTYLRRPASALYLEGPPGVGKTLLACGLARLWTQDGPAALEECLGNFNAEILKCPLIFGDEVAPKDFQGKVKTGQIREFIQAKQHPLKRKYVDSDTVRGCVRLIFAANNNELLSSNEHLTVNDIAALTERFLHIQAQPEALEFLKRLRADPTKPPPESWVEKDYLAEHALFLRDTIPLREDARLLASGGASTLSMALTIGTGIRSAVLHWLVLYLLDPSKLAQNPANALIRIHNGRLTVCARIFAEAWDTYKTNTQAPTAGRIALAVSGLAAGPRVHLRDRNGQETWYREIATENLVAWAEDNGYASGDTIRAILERMGKLPSAQPPVSTAN